MPFPLPSPDFPLVVHLRSRTPDAAPRVWTTGAETLKKEQNGHGHFQVATGTRGGSRIWIRDLAFIYIESLVMVKFNPAELPSFCLTSSLPICPLSSGFEYPLHFGTPEPIRQGDGLSWYFLRRCIRLEWA